MKLRDTLLRPNLKIDHNDSLGRGMDVAFTFLVFVGIGLGLDLVIGTLPWLTIVFSALGAVGLFARYKYRYDTQMERLERERADKGGSTST
ncbi:MAG: AtpZ/AtpI family protein [Actinomycetota bacterium]